MVKTAVLVSGGGTNLQAIIDAKLLGNVKNCELTAVIASKPDAYALIRAQNANIPVYIVDVQNFPDRTTFTEAVLRKLIELDIELVVMAGFMFVLETSLVSAFRNRIINIHPALIPAFCGAGYYGLRVHREALSYGVKVTGATVHFATEEPDGGPIILQKAIDIHEGDTAEILQRRVMEEAEWVILPEAISLYCEGRLTVKGRIVHIADEKKEAAE